MNFLQNSTKYILGTAEITENDVQSPPFVQGLLAPKRTYLCRTRGVDGGDIIYQFYYSYCCGGSTILSRCDLLCLFAWSCLVLTEFFDIFLAIRNNSIKKRHTCFRKIKRPKSKLKIKTLMTHQCWRLKILECATVSCMLPVK